MQEHELPSIGVDAALRALKNGGTLAPLYTSFCTAGGTAFTHSLRTKRGTLYRVSRQVAKALLSSAEPAQPSDTSNTQALA